MRLFSYYKSLSFEEKTIFATKFSLGLNIVLAVLKFLGAILFKNFFLFIAGVVNILFLFAKLECLFGLKKKDHNYKKRSVIISLILILCGLMYIVYMSRLFFKEEVEVYSMNIAIFIALVSFVELGIAIKGLFNAYKKIKYFFQLKCINLCSVITSMVLTSIAIMSFADENPSNHTNALFGIGAGILIIFIAIIILMSLVLSIEDKKYINYRGDLDISSIEIQLTFSKIYGNYKYIANKKNGIFVGTIIKTKSPIKNWNIYLKIFCIILSEILIFAYAIGFVMFQIKATQIFKKIDLEANKLGLNKVIA